MCALGKAIQVQLLKTLKVKWVAFINRLSKALQKQG